MLNPIDADRVIHAGGASGVFPGQIHEGVAWWVGACLVVTQRADQIAVAHNEHPVIAAFADRFCRGAINAQHYACTVHTMGVQTREQLLARLRDLGGAPGAWLAGEDCEGATTVRICLFDGQGVELDDSNGLGKIRRLIAEDRVPIPVNDRAKGRIVPTPTPTWADSWTA
ncbi:hypothetical protein [Streptomyces similanensis]|uniref:Chemoreceptor glutamine deamidase CheD n=1 Tax=Streptomyces similanensis TaxID=1274988 RepID=A0ABP9L813_9ACTN